MIIPNIWKVISHVPNHQSAISLMNMFALDSLMIIDSLVIEMSPIVFRLGHDLLGTFQVSNLSCPKGPYGQRR